MPERRPNNEDAQNEQPDARVSAGCPAATYQSAGLCDQEHTIGMTFTTAFDVLLQRGADPELFPSRQVLPRKRKCPATFFASGLQ